MWVKNITNSGRFCYWYLNIPCLGINITFILYQFFKQLIHALVGKLKNTEMFLLVSGSRICVPLNGTQTWRLHTRVFPNISHMKYRTHLILGKALAFAYLSSFIS